MVSQGYTSPSAVKGLRTGLVVGAVYVQGVVHAVEHRSVVDVLALLQLVLGVRLLRAPLSSPWLYHYLPLNLYEKLVAQDELRLVEDCLSRFLSQRNQSLVHRLAVGHVDELKHVIQVVP